jgi:processive 1,2-diacylglycerol beta-glucosyltransferase
MEAAMIEIYNKRSGALIGTVSPEQLQFLKDQMEEESLEDKDYSITPLEVEYFLGQGAEPELVNLLRTALGEEKEVIIEWREG